jgi:ribose-phosphate pyrophosphokinase
MSAGEMLLFALGPTREFGERVARDLGVHLADHEEREFEDGEFKARSLVPVRGDDVYVLHSLYGEPGQSAADKLVRLAFFIGALCDAGAGRVTAVTPYLAFSRKDRRTKHRDPVNTRYVAEVLEAVGTDRVVTMDVHNDAAYENAFRIPAEHLEIRPLLAEHITRVHPGATIAVVSPDAGGMKRAEALRQTLAGMLDAPVGRAFCEKYRSEDVLSGSTFVGEVEGCVTVIVDDLIASGSTMARAAAACRSAGAAAVIAAATHGLFTGEAGRILEAAPLESVVVSDTVPPFRLEPEGKLRQGLVVLPAHAVFAAAVERLYEDLSLVELIDYPPGDARATETSR